MALTSPGVQVSVIDESFYTPAEPGTRPLFIVASAANKTNASSTGTAQGTLAANAGRVYTVTSQRELADLFGDPTFRVDTNNNPIHAGELNEYGLQAAYSFLGVANSALVVRADIDLNGLTAQAEAPGGEPQDGTFWLDTTSSAWGIFQWNGQAVTTAGGQSFAVKAPLIVLDSTQLEADTVGGKPKTSVGAIGDYAVSVGLDSTGSTPDDRDSHIVGFYYKNKSNEWVKLGSPEWVASWATVQTNNYSTSWSAGAYTLTLNGSPVPGMTSATSLTTTANAINLASIGTITAAVVNNKLEIYTEGNSILLGGTLATGLAALGISNTTYYAPKLTIAPHTTVPAYKSKDANPRPTGSIWIKTTEPNQGARWRLKKYNGDTQLWESLEAPIYSSSEAALAGLDKTGGGANLALNSAYVQSNFNEEANPVAEFRVMRRFRAGATVVKSKAITGISANTWSFQLSESIAGSSTRVTKLITLTTSNNAGDADVVAAAVNAAGFTNVVASVDSSNRVVITHNTGGDMRFADLGDSTNFVGTQLGLNDNANVYNAPADDATFAYVASNWIPLTITPDTATVVQQSYYISADNPETLVADGTLWYSSVVDQVDIMIHNGNTWVGYLNYDHGDGAGQTDPAGPLVSASEPTTQSTGDPLAEGDLWIDTSDIDNYPVINKYDNTNKKWVVLDTSDQTTENGVLFADARYNTTGANSGTAGNIEALLSSNYLDTDAPDPALYPKGMLLFNLRRSGFNVKKFVKSYIDPEADNQRFDNTNSPLGGSWASGQSQASYYPHRWVTESGNQANGSGSFGRKAQRKVIVQSLQAVVNSNQEIRDTERNTFNLLACPGYPELIGELISLNYDRGLTAFVVGDTPARLTPDATTINNWGTNVALALQDDDTGLVSFDEYLGVFYPWGFTSDNAGRDIAVPPSHMILRMIALSDQVSYPWFAPAGTRRGGITNATAVGYVDDEGEFQSVALNEGQRDTLYNVKVNPITFFVGSGLVNFGQKTRARNASALDRINVARLVIYLRSQLNKLAKPYIFEPNDKITRDEIKQQVESLLLELVGQRALYDFLVVCDESNNTPNRIDRNELYVDIAIEPVKAVEFIYIPVRLKNTGEIAGL